METNSLSREKIHHEFKIELVNRFGEHVVVGLIPSTLGIKTKYVSCFKPWAELHECIYDIGTDFIGGFMHPSCVFFLEDVARRFSRHFRNAKVLEIGSCEINESMQSTVRPFFSNCDYIGVDKQLGPFVDVVSDINDCDFSENSFDTIVVLSVFEHDPTWRKTLANCIKWMKNGGICIASFGVEGNPFHLPEPWKPVPHKEFLAELVNHPVCLVVGLFEEDWYCYGTEAFSCVLRKGTLRPDIWGRSPGRYEWQGDWVPNPVHEPEDPMPVAKCYRVPSQDIIDRGGTR